MNVRKSDVSRIAGKVKLHGESPPDDEWTWDRKELNPGSCLNVLRNNDIQSHPEHKTWLIRLRDDD
jgi:hypothetical protein